MNSKANKNRRTLKIVSALCSLVFFAIAAGVVYAGINDNLVSYWKFDEGAADTCTGSEDTCDSAGSLHGERSGASGSNNKPQWSSGIVPTIAADNPYSMHFDGTDDQITGVGDINFSGNAFSSAAWIRPGAWGNSGTANIRNILCDEGGPSTFCFRLGSKGDSALKQRIAVMIYTNTSNDYESSSNLTLDTWNHVAVTFDGTNVRFYINGVLDRTQAASITMNNGASDFRIGSSPDQNRYYNGYLDELRIYNRAITANEVAELAGVNPGVNTLSPADDATSVDRSTEFVITFDRSMVAVGSKNIYIKKTSDDSTIETIATNNTSYVTVSGSTVTINPTSTLAASTSYYLLIDSGGFEDTTGNDYSGIAEPDTWNFTTASVPVPEFSTLMYLLTLTSMGLYVHQRLQTKSNPTLT